MTLSPDEAFHPAGEGTVVVGTLRLSGLNRMTISFWAVLADFEFAFDATDLDAEADDAG